MRKSIYALLLVLMVHITGFSQNNPRPTRSRFWNSNQSTFSIKPGDILVYEITDGDKIIDFIATIKKWGNDVSFDYLMAGGKEKGTVTIPASEMKSAITSDNSFNKGGNKMLKDKIALWISNDSYRALASDDKETKMDVGWGVDTFVRQTASTLKVKYKGTEKIMTVYKVANMGSGKKEFSVLTDINNPLIVKLDYGWKAILKEVR